MKQYTLSESDRRLLDASLRQQRSSPPRPTIVKMAGKEFESADSWWALPPCETGIPAAIIFDDGRVVPSAVMCCIYQLNTTTGVIEAYRDAKGAVVRRWVSNAYPNVINSLVRIHQNKNGDWSNEPIALESSEESTSSTTPSANTTLPPSPCDGECVWIAGLDEGGSVVWKTPPSGGCRNTTTSTSAPTTFTPGSTTATSTTPMPCTERKCRLRCVQVTTPAGTTSWPPAPYVPLRYEEVLDLDNPGCAGPCTCYGVGDPCWMLNATVASQCVYVNTTTSTSTTTSGPLPNGVCDWLNGGAAGPPNPNKYVAGAWSDFRNGGWQVCNACPEGKEPWLTADNWDFADQENLIPVAKQEFFDIARENNPGTPWEPVVGAWRFESGCRISPCSLGGEITATEFEAEYRALTKEDVYRYWIANACDVFGREALREIFYLGNENIPVPGCDIPLTEEHSNAIWTRIFNLSDSAITPKISHRTRWSVCKSCPPGTRPVRPPKPFIYELPENTDGALVDGVWVYKTQCVKGIDCGECVELPAFQTSGQATPAPGPTTTLAPCGCEPPKFCPTVVDECTRTRCVPGGSNVPPPCTTGKPAACYDWVYKVECDCAGSTTNTSTSSTTTSTTTSACTQNQCRWVLSAEIYGGGAERILTWVQTAGCGGSTLNLGGGSSLLSSACNCASVPPTTTVPSPGPPGQLPDIEIGVGNCGDVYTANCVLASTSTCAPTGNCLNCSNGCYWGAFRYGPSTLVWSRLYNDWGGPSGTNPTPTPPGCRYTPGGSQQPAAFYFNPDGSPSCPSIGKNCDEWLAGRTEGFLNDNLGGNANCLAAITEIPSGCINSCDQYYPNRNWGCGQFGRRKPCVCREPAYPPSDCDWMVFTPCEQIAPPRCACCATTTVTPCLRSCVYKGDGSGGWTQLSNPCLTSCPCPSPLGQSKDSCDRLELACGSRPSTTSPPSSTSSTTTTARPQGSCCYSGYNPTGCVVTWQIECTSAGGSWRGGNTNCTSHPCPVTTTLAPLGRCCYNFGQCAINNAAQCGVLGGTWTSGVLSCVGHNCPTTPAPTTTVTSTTSTTVPLGRCCYGPNNVLCSSGRRFLECESLNGIWTQGVTCNTASCGGFCCYLVNGQPACSESESIASCDVLGGSWFSYSSHPAGCYTFNYCATTPAPTTTQSPGSCSGAECTYQSLDGTTWTLMQGCTAPCNCPTPANPPEFEGDVATLNCVSP